MRKIALLRSIQFSRIIVPTLSSLILVGLSGFSTALLPTTVVYAQAVDTEPPVVLFTNPQDGQTNVDVFLFGFDMTITFSEELDPASITASSIMVEDSEGNAASGEVVYCSGCFDPTAIFGLLSPLEFSTTYLVTVSGEVRDLAGNTMGDDYTFSFTTVDPDTTPPAIDHTIPADGDSLVPVYVDIVAIFDGPISSEVPSDNWFIITDENGNQVAGTATLQGFGIAVFFPSSDLEFATTYTATIKAGIKDDSGNPIAADYVWTFTTKSEKEARAKILAFDSAASAHAIWIEEGEDGSRDVTQIDLRENTDSDTGATIGTSITLSNFVEDANGNTLVSAFGAFFTPEDVYDFSSNLNSAKLMPVQVPMLVCDLDGCSNTVWTIESDWKGSGKIERVHDSFTYISGAIDKSKLRAGSELQMRTGTAIGSLNGQDLGTSSTEFTFISFQQSDSTKYGDIDLGIGLSIGDYIAPTFEQGVKTVRGGEGTTADGFWEIENPDGTRTLISLFVADMHEEVGRLTFFFDETQIFLDRVVIDQDGNIISEEFGSVVIPIPENRDFFTVGNKLRNAVLSPVDIELCSFEDRDEFFNCTAGDIVTVAATWQGVGELGTEHFRFTAMADCEEILCANGENNGQFNIKIIGSGQQRDAVVKASLDGVDIGEGDPNPLGVGSTLNTSERLEIQYGLPFPFGIFPIIVQ